VLAAGRAAKLPARQLRQLAAWIERLKPDRKAADARLLLRRLARTGRCARTSASLWPAPGSGIS
jgi:hypothetical protein